MKNKIERPCIEKFRVAELNRPETIIGGDPGDDITDGNNQAVLCLLFSTIIING